MIKGQRPPPCSDFALSGISGSRAVLFGGYQHNGLQEELYVVDFDPIKLVSKQMFNYKLNDMLTQYR